MIVKVCGLCVADNIREIRKLDVDWVGLIFCPSSPRYVKQLGARGGFYPDYSPFAKSPKELGGQPTLSARVNKPKRVGVFADDMPQNIVTRVYNFYLDILQLHGEELPVMIENLRRTLDPDIRPVKIMKTIMLESEADLEKCKDYESVVDYFLFHTKSGLTGCGKRFDWSILNAYKGNVPFLIGGGIAPEDAEAVKAFKHPQFVGVDINSKFEIEPGVKDVEKVKQFVEAVKA